MYFWSPDTGWAADVRDLVVTRDGGQTWTPLLSVYGGTPRMDKIGYVDALNAQVWWFEEASGLWVTTDGGQTWTTWPMVVRRPDGTPEAGVEQIVLVSPTEAWGIEIVSVTPEALRHTQNAGRTWTRVALPTAGLSRVNLQRLVFPSAQVGWVALTSGHIFRTTDGGHTWERRGQPPRPLLQLTPLDAQTAWALDLRRVQVYRTTDGGRTWSKVHDDLKNWRP